MVLEKLDDVIMKKAFGFSYTEENLEYERATSKEFLFCKAFGRLYLKRGYIKAREDGKGAYICDKYKNLKFSLKRKVLLNARKSMPRMKMVYKGD